MPTIPLENILYLLVPLFITWYFYYKWTDDKKEIIISSFRMLFQLLLIGYLLLFIFEEKHILLGVVILSFMAIVSAHITLRNTKNKNFSHYSIIFVSILISVLIHLFIVIFLVLDIGHFYEPRYVIPIAGMIFANTMNALSIYIDRFESELSSTKNIFESRKVAFKTAMIPQINSLLAVGLVSLPGMMTGQILGGVDPLIAVRYQIIIMLMILSNAGISIVVYFFLNKKRYKIKTIYS